MPLKLALDWTDSRFQIRLDVPFVKNNPARETVKGDGGSDRPLPNRVSTALKRTLSAFTLPVIPR